MTVKQLQNRSLQIRDMFPDMPNFRFKQINKALFDSNIESWQEVTTLSKDMREALSQQIPWMSVTESKVFESSLLDTYKAVLKTSDGYLFETVLMENKRGYWTICVSSQVGCAMKCSFCATGTMGLKRSLIADEIIDQYRFWQQFLKQRPELPQVLSNIVFMGMGEPLANYEEVKEALIQILQNTEIGPTKITVSTVGLLPQLEKILVDPNWPAVRIAISLHSADTALRKKIIPTSHPDFVEKVLSWVQRYNQRHGNRRHHVTFEYILLNGVNDSKEDAVKLAKFVQKAGSHLINVMPYNNVLGKDFQRSQLERIDQFKQVLRSYDLDVTQRRAMGNDIMAACGQLVLNQQ